MSYASMLDSIITYSKLNLEEIADRCKQNGVDIHASYISKLRKGTRPAPSDEISRAIAEACRADAEALIIQGNIERTPKQIIDEYFRYKNFYESWTGDIPFQISKIIDNELFLRIFSAQHHMTPEGMKHTLLNIKNYMENRPKFVPMDFNVDNIKGDKPDALSLNFLSNCIQGMALPPVAEYAKNRIPIITSKIAAGLPILADGTVEDYVDIPPMIKADFASYVKGDSMLYAGIHDGDLAFFHETNFAQSGQVVAARKIDMESEINLKFYIQNNGGYVLRSANPAYPDQLFTQNHTVIGILCGLWRNGAPSTMDYKYMLAMGQTEEWQEVAEAAAAYGWNAKQIKNLIDLHGSLNKKI